MKNFEEIIEVLPDQVLKKSNQGTVVLGRIRATKEEVVIKMSQEFTQHDTVDHRAGDRLHVLRELRILPQLIGIQGVPQFLASERVMLDSETEQFRLAMTKIEGIDFEERRKLDPKRRLTTVEALDMLKQTAQILKQVHARGIIHRDLKLSNFMINEAGQIFVVDWGTAKEVKDQTDQIVSAIDHPDLVMGRTPENTVIGTVQFVSYEQITGQALDERTDVYSLGAVIALMRYGPQITQRYTIDKDGKVHNREKRDIAKAVAAAETLKYTIMPQPNSPGEDTLQHVIRAMTNPDRRERLQNMQEVLDLLAAAPSHIE